MPGNRNATMHSVLISLNDDDLRLLDDGLRELSRLTGALLDRTKTVLTAIRWLWLRMEMNRFLDNDREFPTIVK